MPQNSSHGDQGARRSSSSHSVLHGISENDCLRELWAYEKSIAELTTNDDERVKKRMEMVGTAHGRYDYILDAARLVLEMHYAVIDGRSYGLEAMVSSLREAARLLDDKAWCRFCEEVSRRIHRDDSSFCRSVLTRMLPNVRKADKKCVHVGVMPPSQQIIKSLESANWRLLSEDPGEGTYPLVLMSLAFHRASEPLLQDDDDFGPEDASKTHLPLVRKTLIAAMRRISYGGTLIVSWSGLPDHPVLLFISSHLRRRCSEVHVVSTPKAVSFEVYIVAVGFVKLSEQFHSWTDWGSAFEYFLSHKSHRVDGYDEVLLWTLSPMELLEEALGSSAEAHTPLASNKTAPRLPRAIDPGTYDTLWTLFAGKYRDLALELGKNVKGKWKDELDADVLRRAASPPALNCKLAHKVRNDDLQDRKDDLLKSMMQPTRPLSAVVRSVNTIERNDGVNDESTQPIAKTGRPHSAVVSKEHGLPRPKSAALQHTKLDAIGSEAGVKKDDISGPDVARNGRPHSALQCKSFQRHDGRNDESTRPTAKAGRPHSAVSKDISGLPRPKSAASHCTKLNAIVSEAGLKKLEISGPRGKQLQEQESLQPSHIIDLKSDMCIALSGVRSHRRERDLYCADHMKELTIDMLLGCCPKSAGVDSETERTTRPARPKSAAAVTRTRTPELRRPKSASIHRTKSSMPISVVGHAKDDMPKFRGAAVQDSGVRFSPQASTVCADSMNKLPLNAVRDPRSRPKSASIKKK